MVHSNVAKISYYTILPVTTTYPKIHYRKDTFASHANVATFFFFFLTSSGIQEAIFLPLTDSGIWCCWKIRPVSNSCFMALCAKVYQLNGSAASVRCAVRSAGCIVIDDITGKATEFGRPPFATIRNQFERLCLSPIPTEGRRLRPDNRR